MIHDTNCSEMKTFLRSTFLRNRNYCWYSKSSRMQPVLCIRFITLSKIRFEFNDKHFNTYIDIWSVLILFLTVLIANSSSSRVISGACSNSEFTSILWGLPVSWYNISITVCSGFSILSPWWSHIVTTLQPFRFILLARALIFLWSSFTFPSSFNLSVWLHFGSYYRVSFALQLFLIWKFENLLEMSEFVRRESFLYAEHERHTAHHSFLLKPFKWWENCSLQLLCFTLLLNIHFFVALSLIPELRNPPKISNRPTFFFSPKLLILFLQVSSNTVGYELGVWVRCVGRGLGIWVRRECCGYGEVAVVYGCKVRGGNSELCLMMLVRAGQSKVCSTVRMQFVSHALQ